MNQANGIPASSGLAFTRSIYHLSKKKTSSVVSTPLGFWARRLGTRTNTVAVRFEATTSAAPPIPNVSVFECSTSTRCGSLETRISVVPP